ncbi:proto-oncogene tyrosine-protein kinase receptor Ret [Venturia canescens]|uniref:proto-oncogene tyrosine-protein kinase receptor Ret n=1 Tax=Venturia canescens TaxID=32260 RepID=UPI001C9BE5AC|nr:proto-oncogene tyrosine-protein kinase receptor Ret [Venturia canescens]
MGNSGTPRASAPLRLALPLLLLFAAFASALYFPQSNLTLRLPYLAGDEGKSDLELVLLSLRTLRNDSSAPKEPKYNIASPRESFASLDSRTGGDIVLHSMPKKGATKTLIVEARERGSDEAILGITVEPIVAKSNRINCTEYVQDVCFWHVARYKIYENQPATMLGKIGPSIYRQLCPELHIVRYELLNGTNYVHILDDELYSNASLDRDTSKFPGGPGPRITVAVRCVVWDGNTGIQHVRDSNINVNVLDEDDNPPIAQINKTIQILLSDFSAGHRLDSNELVFKDADSITSNRYVARILGDTENALNITYDTMSVEHYARPEPPSTAIYARIFARTTLLPKSPYKVILQVTDESLLPGYGKKSVNISISFVGPQHHASPTTVSPPTKRPISFPGSVTIARSSTIYSRLVQPLFKPNQAAVFTIQDSKIFNVTRKNGIVYVANSTLLQSAPTAISLTIQWRISEHKQSSATLIVNLVDAVIAKGSSCNRTSVAHSCANFASQKECESHCGIGSGSLHENTLTSECVWRSNNMVGMTERYQTCSPNLTHCPDNVCDDLERLDSRICPQDCATESEVHFAILNKDGRGISSASGICKCDDEMQCTCGLFHGNSVDGNSNGGNKSKRERKKEAVVSDARKASDGGCGPTCMIGAVGASFFVLIVFVSAFVMWRYRGTKKSLRRECKHRGVDGANGLGILPSDYLDRGDGHLIGLDSFSGLNRSLLLPKASPPDPKWEFPRSRLTIEQVLGEGEFGRVLRAKAVDIGGWPGPTTVAVKTLKEDASASELADLLSEYQLLKEAQHPNVIRLLGACTSPGGPVYLIIEFAEFGSLRNYLRRSRHLESEGRAPCSTSLLSASPGNAREELQTNDTTSNYAITPRDILSFAWQISKGMAYLTDIKLVHRDLAARNVLLATGKVCKISDFGLTRDVYEDDAYLKRSKGRVPVKWMAPESLADHVYTSKSDVWSFGVLLWELVTLGASPYPGVDVHNLYNLLKAGYRMERPANCSTQLYKLMVSCWHDEPGMRPSFKELTCHWERMLEDGVEYLDLNPRTVHNQAYFASLHALDSPTSSSVEGMTNGNLSIIRTEAFNYMSKPSEEPIKKCDKVDKLQALWHEPIASFPEESGKCAPASYENDRTVNINANHYESPIKLRNLSVASNSENDLKTPSNERPQSYIDMAGKRGQNGHDDLLMFNNIDRIDKDDRANSQTKQ